MSSEEYSFENIIEEKQYNVKTDTDNEMELTLRNINDEKLSITLKTINQFPSAKYELCCTLEDFQKNRFFKIFINIREIIRELDDKIQKSTFFQQTNTILIDIPIGLKVINEILLEIRQKEKNYQEQIEYFKEKIEKLDNLIKDLKNENYQLKKKIRLKEEDEEEKIKEEESELKGNKNK
jgi:hypothetical protein